MSSLKVAFLLGVIVVVALGVGWWLSSTFLASRQGFAGVYAVSAYLDSNGNSCLCFECGSS
jgi:hypothetical protein